MAIFEPQGFNPGQVGFVPTFDVGEFDFSQFEQLSDEMIDIENDRLDRIEENYNSLMDTKDALLGLDPGSIFGKSVIDRKRKDYNITDDIFNFSMDDLRDPFKHRQVRSSLNGLVNDQEVKNVLLEGQEIAKFDQFIKRLERTNPGMAVLAKRDINKVRQDPSGRFNIYNIQPSDYEEVDFSKILADELDNLPNDVKIEKRNDGDGYIIFSEVNDFQMTEEEFAEMVADKYSDDPRVANTFRSKVDPTKAPGDRSINDPDAVQKYLKEQAGLVFSNYEGLATKHTIKEDKLLVDNMRTINDIKLKTTTPGKNTSPTKSYKDGEVQGFDAKTFGKFGSIVGTQLSDEGFLVGQEDLMRVNRAFDKGQNPQRIVNQDGSVSYTVQNDLGEAEVIGNFKKLPTSAGFIGSGVEERYLNANPVLRRSSVANKNLALSTMRNPIIRGADGVSEGPLQDVFFDEVMYPRYATWKAEIENDPDLAEKAAEKGIYGNKLFYLLHHNGFGKTKEYIEKGTAPIKGNVNSDSEITGAFARTEAKFGENWNDVPTSEYIKWAESQGNPAALYKGDQNSSAFGAYQFTLSSWGKELREFIGERAPGTLGSTTPAAATSETGTTQFSNVQGFFGTETPTPTPAVSEEVIPSVEPSPEVEEQQPLKESVEAVTKGPHDEKLDQLASLAQKKIDIQEENIFGDDISGKLEEIDNEIKEIEQSIQDAEDTVKDQEKIIAKKDSIIATIIDDLKPTEETKINEFNTQGQGQLTITKSESTPPKYRLKMGNTILGVYTEEELTKSLRSFPTLR